MSSARTRITPYLVMMMAITDLSAQQGPTTGYAPVNGLRMYYEVHGRGEPVVLLHGGFMTIPSTWDGWIGELSRTRKVIAVEMQGHGRTADIPREFASENGTELNAILPKMSPLNPQFKTKKQTVFQKIAAFVEKFKGVGGHV